MKVWLPAYFLTKQDSFFFQAVFVLFYFIFFHLFFISWRLITLQYTEQFYLSLFSFYSDMK